MYIDECKRMEGAAVNPEVKSVVLWANSEDTELEVKRELKRLRKFENPHDEEEE